MEQTTEELTECPVCRSLELRQALGVTDFSVTHEHFFLFDCLRCGFRFTNPRPAAEYISRYYDSDNYISHTDASLALQDRIYRSARRIALRAKHRLIRQLQPSGKVLDVGTGTGAFLGYLQSRGYAGVGVEPNLKARELAISQHSLEILPSLEDIPGLEQFQVTTLWHVLEHMPDLRGTMRKLFSCVAPKGLLVIAVPDRESWDCHHYGPYWAAWDVPRHLSHFKRSDVQLLLAEHGFQLLHMRRMWMDAPYVSLLSEQYKGHGRLSALVRGAAVGTWSNLVAVFGNRPTSSTLYIARKG